MTNRVPLTQLDPAEAWAPWRPDEKQPWNLKWAGHLYRRAAFGANLDELRQAVQQGLPATLNKLVEGDTEADERFQEFLRQMGRGVGRKNNSYMLRVWWLYAMLNSPYPLREKMTLFWHNHFATS